MTGARGRARGWVLGISILAIPAVQAGFLMGQSAGKAGEHPATPSALPAPGQPHEAKARKTFAEGVEWERQRLPAAAIDCFRKANKQDGGHCTECLQRAYQLAIQIGDYKTGQRIGEEALTAAVSNTDRATAHYQIGMALQHLGVMDKKAEYFRGSVSEFKTALELDPNFTGLHFPEGVSLAYLHEDDAARTEFESFVGEDKQWPALHARARRFADRVELARARMAPTFVMTTLDGKRISMDDLAGKVVLIDFWATWCGPCREALPHLRKMIQNFQGQPFVALSISLDSNEAAWRKFVASNGMTWPQGRDGGKGAIADLFKVNAIPATFSIDADGVVEDQHVGDEAIEGKLKKLIAQALERQNQKRAAEAVTAQAVH